MLSAALRLLHRVIGATLARIIMRRMRRDGVPVTPEQRRKMARVLHREVVAQRRRSHAQAVKSIREFDPKIVPADPEPYPLSAVESVLERAVNPPPPKPATEPEPQRPIEVEPEPDTGADEPRSRATAPDEEARPRASVMAPEEQSRERARVSAPEVAERPRGRVVAPAELDPRSRRQARSRVVAPTLENRTDPTVVRQVAARATATLTRHVAQAGRDAVINTALGAGEEIGWARVLSGAENCAFCAMLASRGPVYRSDKSALRVVGRNGRPRGSRALGEAYHDHCDCECVLVRRGESWEGQAEFERLERLWTAASIAGAELNEEARRTFNRAFRRIEKDAALGDEIEQLWTDSTAGLSGSEALRAFRAAIKENPPAALAAARSPRRATE